MKLGVLVPVSCYRVLRSRPSPALARLVQVLRTGESPVLLPGHGVENTVHRGARVQPEHLLLAGLEVGQHGLESPGSREVRVVDVETVDNNRQLALSRSLPRLGDDRPDEGGRGEDDGLVRGDVEVRGVGGGGLPHLHQHLGPGDLVEHYGHVEPNTSKYPVVQLREKSNKEADKAGQKIDFWIGGMR